MSVKTWLAKALGVTQTQNLPVLYNRNSQLLGLNNGVSIYPYGNDLTYIQKGYNKNAWVYAIVSKCAKKFSQVPWYHYKIKTSERKTYQDYLLLTKNSLSDNKARLEAKKMLTKSVDQVIVDSPLSKLLAKPNRNQSGAAFREQLYGYKLLTGEGNIWMSRPMENGVPDMNQRPKELFIIPKQHLALVKGGDPWAIESYKLLLGGVEFDNPKDNIIMWIFPNYEFDPYTLSHLRGQSPLDAGLLTMQASNEATERTASMNKNQGVAGMVYDKSMRDYPTQAQAYAMRGQFNSIVNDKDLAGTIAYLTGDLGFFQFGMNAQQLELLKQSDVHFQTLCNIFDVPWQLFGNADSYENRKQYKRDFIYDNIAVAAYGLRDELNAKLIPEFNLDRDRDVIDIDLMNLPELTEDLGQQIDAITKAIAHGIMTPNEGRKEVGHEESTDPNMFKYYMNSGLVPLDQVNSEILPPLDDDLLNDD